LGCGAIPEQAAPQPSLAQGPESEDPGFTAPASTTTQCPAGEFDMLDWATMDPDLAAGFHMAGNATPLYTVIQNGKFYWLKSDTGFPWDIQLTDRRYIYLWVTEQDWNNPYSFKKSTNNTNMPLAPRCAKGGYPGSSVQSANTSFQIVHSCIQAVTSNLGTMVNEVWGPYKLSLGGSLPNNMDVLVVSYRYNCDAGYGNCQDREEYTLNKRSMGW
jgi:hypothetical protein